MHALFSACSSRDDNMITSKCTWKLKHANSILEPSKYFCQISSKFIIISSYTISKLGRFFETKCIYTFTTASNHCIHCFIVVYDSWQLTVVLAEDEVVHAAETEHIQEVPWRRADPAPVPHTVCSRQIDSFRVQQVIVVGLSTVKQYITDNSMDLRKKVKCKFI